MSTLFSFASLRLGRPFLLNEKRRCAQEEQQTPRKLVSESVGRIAGDHNPEHLESTERATTCIASALRIIYGCSALITLHAIEPRAFTSKAYIWRRLKGKQSFA